MNKLILENFEAEVISLKEKNNNWVKIGLSTCGVASGAEKIYEVFKSELEKRAIEVAVLKCGCAGMCYAEPLVEVAIEGMPRVIYGNVDESTALRIVRKHIADKEIINDHVYTVREY